MRRSLFALASCLVLVGCTRSNSELFRSPDLSEGDGGEMDLSAALGDGGGSDGATVDLSGANGGDGGSCGNAGDPCCATNQCNGGGCCVAGSCVGSGSACSIGGTCANG